MLLVIDDILDFLGDGEWHGFVEVADNFRSLGGRFERVLGFLAEHGFINLDEKRKRVKINSAFSKFLQAIKRIEEGGNNF